MYPPIVCFTCGRSIGDLYDVFLYLRQCKIEKAKGALEPTGVKTLRFRFIQDNDVRCDDIFRALGIDMQCCKLRLLSAVEFKEYY